MRSLFERNLSYKVIICAFLSVLKILEVGIRIMMGVILSVLTYPMQSITESFLCSGYLDLQSPSATLLCSLP
jgi:hypothetical protein